MKSLLLSGWVLLSCTCLRAQDFVTHNGFVSFFGEKPFESVRADNHEVEAIIHTKTGDVEFHTPIKSFHFENKAIEWKTRQDRPHSTGRNQL